MCKTAGKPCTQVLGGGGWFLFPGVGAPVPPQGHASNVHATEYPPFMYVLPFYKLNSQHAEIQHLRAQEKTLNNCIQILLEIKTCKSSTGPEEGD